MTSIRRLAYRDAFVWSLVQTMTGGSGLLPPVYFTEGVPTSFVVSFTLEEWTKVLSALYTGADLSYPEQAHEVVWSLVKQVEYPADMAQYGGFRDIWAYQWSVSAGGALSVSANTSQYHNMSAEQSPAAVNDAIVTAVPMALQAGGYAAEYLYIKLTNGGVATLDIVHTDGTVVPVLTADQWAAAPANNQRTTGLFTLPKAGNWTLRKRVLSKNASSSGFISRFTAVSLWRSD